MRKILSVALFVLFSSVVFGQYTDMEWTQHKLDFKVPADFKINTNNAEQFSAGSDVFTMTINPYKDATKTANDVAKGIYDRMNATEKTVVAQEGFEQNGFKGYYMIGLGKQDGNQLVFLCMGLIDPDSDINFEVEILFWYDEATYEKNLTIAGDIADSFKKK